MTYFNNKVIWITGASSGIGKALAQHLSQYNCKLIISARRQRILEEVKSQCLTPEHIGVLPFDLGNLEKLPKIVEQGMAIFGKVDIMVLNGGISQRSELLHTQLRVDKTLIEIDYLSNVALSKALLPHFINQNFGQFVVVTSLMGKFSSPLRSAYCGAKHALHGYFNALRLEHEDDGVIVTFICPGFVNTDVARNALTSDGSAQGFQDVKTEQGVPVDQFAKKMAKAIKRQKFEAYIGGFETVGIWVSRLSPKLIHAMVKRMKVR